MSSLKECSSCLGTGETMHRGKNGGMFSSDCHVCKGVGEVESVVDEHFLHQEVFN